MYPQKHKSLLEVKGESLFFFRLCAILKNISGLINGYEGFDRYAQTLLATIIVAATAIQKPWVK